MMHHYHHYQHYHHYHHHFHFQTGFPVPLTVTDITPHSGHKTDSNKAAEWVLEIIKRRNSFQSITLWNCRYMRSSGVRMVFGNDLVTSVFHNFAEWVLWSKHHRLKLTALISLNDQNVHLSLTPSKGALPTTDRNRLTRKSFIILYIFSLIPSLKIFPTIESE